MRTTKKFIKHITEIAKAKNEITLINVYLQECTLEEMQEIIALMCKGWKKVTNNCRYSFLTKQEGVARRILLKYNPETKMFLPYFSVLCIPKTTAVTPINFIRIFFMSLWRSLKLSDIPKITFDTKTVKSDFEKAIREFFNAPVCAQFPQFSNDDFYKVETALKGHKLASLHGKIRKGIVNSVERT